MTVSSFLVWDSDHHQLQIRKRKKLAFYLHLSKNEVEFYFVVPVEFKTMLKQRINDVWQKKVTIEEVSEVPTFKKFRYCFDYQYEDALSTRVDRRDNDLLASVLNVTDTLKEGSELGLVFNFLPYDQKQWSSTHTETMRKIQNDESYFKEKIGFAPALLMVVNLVQKTLDSFLDLKPVKQSTRFEVTPSTTKKKRQTIVGLQIGLSGTDEDACLSVADAFRVIDEDNNIVRHRYTAKMDLTKYKIGKRKMLISTTEAQSFVSLPGDELLAEHKITHVGITECQVPEELRKGYVRLGENTCQGVKTTAYLMDHTEIGAMPLVLVGEQGAGKSTYLANYVLDVVSRGESAVVIDYIKNCELCSTIKEALVKKVGASKIIDLDLSDVSSTQGFGYNELKPASQRVEDRASIVYTKTTYITRLIDAMAINGDVLSARMSRYLEAACHVVLSSNNASLKDVVNCLNDFKFREVSVKAMASDLKREFADDVEILKELDEIDGKTGKVVGTKFSRIDGINDRIALLGRDYRLKKMLAKGSEGNVDLVSVMEKGKVLLVRMPQAYFSTSYSKNVIVTYLFTKIWAASIVRGMMHKVPLRCHVIIDEIFQCKTTMALIQEDQIVPQTRKFQTKLVVSCQYLNQIETIADTLDAAGASYMLMKGSTKANFKEFKDVISPFTLDDLQALKQYHSLNLINTVDGRKVFVTKLPKPL